jgi:hypothetical protein
VNVAVVLAQHADPALKLLQARGAEREPDPAGEHRGMRAGLELGLILAGERAVFLGLQAGSERGPLDLLTVGMLDIRDPLTHPAKRVTVPVPASVQHRVDREPQALKRREQHLRRSAREPRRVSEPTNREHRLM